VLVLQQALVIWSNDHWSNGHWSNGHWSVMDWSLTLLRQSATKAVTTMAMGTKKKMVTAMQKMVMSLVIGQAPVGHWSMVNGH
jgi:hypothetical protein